MITLLGRTLRRYAVLLLLTSVTGSLSIADRPTAVITPVSITIQSPHHDTPVLPAGVSVVPGRILVRGTLPASLATALGARTVRSLPQIGWRELTVAAAPVQEAVSAARAAGLEAEPVYTGSIATVGPAETCLVPGCAVDQWHWNANAASATWSSSPSEDRVTVAVLDTRIDRTHPDWIGPGGSGPSIAEGGQLRLDGARDLVANHTGSAAYHGTFVAGLVGAALNGFDTIGIAPRGVAILPITVVDGNGTTDAATLAMGVLTAWRAGARVINLSLGIVGDSTAVRDAIRLATTGDAGTPAALVVAAAGNNTGGQAFYPGSYPEVLSVAGTDRDDKAAPCSNFNSNVAVSAPADRLVGLAPMPTRLMQAPCGTSAAAPQVSGVAALLFAQDPSRTPAEVRALIVGTADDLGAPGRDDRFGAGRLNVARALSATGARVSTVAPVIAARNATAVLSAPAHSAGSIVSAEARLDDPLTGPSLTLNAADGAFGGANEQLRGSLNLAGVAPGTHRVFLRARDGAGWGAVTPLVLIIDATAPTVRDLTVSNAVRGAAPMQVSFSASDLHSTKLTYAIELVASATGQRALSPVRAFPGGSEGYSWTLPSSLPPGHYRVVLGVADESGNATRVEAGTIVA